MNRLHSAVLILFLIGAIALAVSGCAGTKLTERNQPASPAGSAGEGTPTPTDAASGDTVEAAEVDQPVEVVDVLAQMTAAAEQPPVDQVSAGATVSEATSEPAAAEATPVAPAVEVTTTLVVTVPPPADAAAMVNGQYIAKADYERQFELQKAAMVASGVDLKKDDGKKLLSIMRRQVLEQMINVILMEEAATAQGVTVTSKQVNAATEKSIKEGGGRAGFEKWLKDIGQTEADYKEMIRVQLITEAIGEKLTGKLPDKAPQVHARHILLNDEATANKAFEEVKAGKDFVALAKKYSQDISNKDQGGDLGWFPRNTLPSELEEVAFWMKPKQVSRPIKDSFEAWHIIQVVEKSNSRALTNEQRHALYAAAFGRWLAEHRQGAQIERYIEFPD